MYDEIIPNLVDYTYPKQILLRLLRLFAWSVVAYISYWLLVYRYDVTYVQFYDIN